MTSIVPPNWSTASLEELCASVSDGDHQAPPKAPTGIPFITISSITDGKVDLANAARFVPLAYKEALEASRDPQKGDILLSVTGSIGRSAIVDDPNFVFQRHIALIKTASSIEGKYIHYFFSYPSTQSQLEDSATGTAQKTLPLSKLRKLSIPLPPLAEQKRIVVKLDALATKSARARTDLARIDTLATRYKQAVLSKAFSGELTKNWQRQELKEFVSEGLVGLVRSKTDQSTEEGVPYIRMNHFDLRGDWNSRNLTLVQVSEAELNTFGLAPNDLLFNTRNSFELVGKVALWEGASRTHVYNNNILRLRFWKDILPKFAFYQMQSGPFRTYLESVKSATTSVCAIYQKSLMKAPFVAPAAEIQEEIVRRIESAFQKIDRLAVEAKRALELVGKLDEAILAKAFKGQLVPQDPNDEPASALLERIKAERAAAPKAKRGRRGGRI